MILLEAYAVGLVFFLGLAIGERATTRAEIVGTILWPVVLPTAFICRWWTRRQVRRWNALTMEQRQALNEQGKGSVAKRWPYRYTPWVPRGLT